MFESLSLPCEKGLFVVLFALGAHPAPGGFPSKGVPVSPARYPVSPPPPGTRCTGSRCCCSAFGSSQRKLTPLFVRHIAQIFSHCSLCILSTPYLYIVTNYILCFRLARYNILCFYYFSCSQLRTFHLRKLQCILVPVRDLLRRLLRYALHVIRLDWCCLCHAVCRFRNKD